MQIGIIGLGRMGGNIARRLMKDGHECVVFDQSPDAVGKLAGEGAVAGTGVADLVARLRKPRVVWIMLPAGAITEHAVDEFGSLMEAGDIIIDGGNSFYQDDVRRAHDARGEGRRYVDVGTSGGVWGLERGYCMMIGGDKDAVDTPRPDLRGPGARQRRHSRDARAARAAIPGPSRATSTAARAAPGTSSRWSITASNTGSCRPMPKASTS